MEKKKKKISVVLAWNVAIDAKMEDAQYENLSGQALSW